MTAPTDTNSDAWLATEHLAKKFTLPDLVAHVNVLLDRFERKMPNRRAVERVDERTVRYYVSKKVIDVPIKKGRTVTYTDRHLLGLLAVKTCQANGLSLAQIKDVMTNPSTRALRRLACLVISSPDNTVPFYLNELGVAHSRGHVAAYAGSIAWSTPAGHVSPYVGSTGVGSSPARPPDLSTPFRSFTEFDLGSGFALLTPTGAIGAFTDAVAANLSLAIQPLVDQVAFVGQS